MANIKKLLKELKDDNKKKRRKAAEDLGEAGDTEEVLTALKDVAQNDDDRGTRKKAEEAAQKVEERMKAKQVDAEPVASSEMDEKWGSSTTTDEWGSSETKEDEWGTTSSEWDSAEASGDSQSYEVTDATEVSKESEDALRLKLVETQRGTIKRNGEIYNPTDEDDQEHYPPYDAKGYFSIKNTGEEDRIWDIDVEVPDLGLTTLEAKYHINELAPQEEWKEEYDIKDLPETLNIVFTETIDTFPQDDSKEEPSNVLVYGQEMETKIKYEMKAEKDIVDIVYEKDIPGHFSGLKVINSTLGKPNIEGGKLVWKIEKLKKDQSASVELSCIITVEDIEVKKTGFGKITFKSKEEGAFSNVNVGGADGLVKNFSYVDADEIEDRPDFWECKLVYENRSEFPVELRDIRISKDDMVYIDHKYEASDGVIIPSGKTWESKVWEVKSEDLPTFEKYVTFTVKPEILYEADSDLSVLEAEMRVANMDSKKGYDIVEVASWRDVIIPTTIISQNIGSLSFSKLKIKDTIPFKFKPAEPEKIKVLVGEDEENLSEIQDYEVTYEPEYTPSEPTEEEETGEAYPERTMLVTINREIMPNEIVKLAYEPTLIKAIKEETFTGEAQISAELSEPGPDLVRDVEAWLSTKTIAVRHQRKAVTYGKQVYAGAEPGIYEIVIVYKNRGDNELEEVKIRDLIPTGFELLDDNMESLAATENVDEGVLRIWTIPKIEANDGVEIIYRMKGEAEDFSAGKAQLGYM